MAEAGADLQHGPADVRSDHVEFVLPVIAGLISTEVVLQGFVPGRRLHHAVIPRHAFRPVSLTQKPWLREGATVTDGLRV
ncbi:hypothetical protein GCM10009677_21110 [Sphaerisporangium rubeum]